MSWSRWFILGCAMAPGLGCDRSVEIGRKGLAVADWVDADENDADEGDAGRVDADRVDADENDADRVDAVAPVVLWSTSAETGDLSDWSRDGSVKGGAYSSHVEISVSREQAHTGTHAMKLSFDSSDGQDHMAELYRRIEPAPAYYGAWFFIDGEHVAKSYWTLLYFFYEKAEGDRATRLGLWDLNLHDSTLYFYDEVNARSIAPTLAKRFEVGRWVHVEAYLDYADRNGHIQAWLDGDLILDVKDLGEAPGDYLYWGVGSDTNGLTPATCTMYVDDATVSTGRLGP